MPARVNQSTLSAGPRNRTTAIFLCTQDPSTMQVCVVIGVHDGMKIVASVRRCGVPFGMRNWNACFVKTSACSGYAQVSSWHSRKSHCSLNLKVRPREWSRKGNRRHPLVTVVLRRLRHLHVSSFNGRLSSVINSGHWLSSAKANIRGSTADVPSPSPLKVWWRSLCSCATTEVGFVNPVFLPSP